jgi:hypothetical protein
MGGLVRLFVASIIVLTVGCGGDSSKKIRPYGSVTIVGVDVEFTSALHIYDSGLNGTVIQLLVSTPADWTVYLSWSGDVDPGSTDTTGLLRVIVQDPASENYLANPLTTSLVTMDTSKWASSTGKFTEGTFSGDVENATNPLDVKVLTNGEFRAVRQ